MEKTLFILCGEAFSGKSTLAKKLSKKFDAVIVGRDVAYFALDKILALEEAPEDLDDLIWKKLWPVAVIGARNHLLLGRSVVFDDTCIRRKERDDLRDMAKECGANCILLFLDTTQQTRKQRHEQNRISGHRHDVPSAWIRQDSEDFEKPGLDEEPVVVEENTEFEVLLKNLTTRNN